MKTINALITLSTVCILTGCGIADNEPVICVTTYTGNTQTGATGTPPSCLTIDKMVDTPGSAALSFKSTCNQLVKLEQIDCGDECAPATTFTMTNQERERYNVRGLNLTTYTVKWTIGLKDISDEQDAFADETTLEQGTVTYKVEELGCGR